jgi:hypothetical protein
MLGLIDLVMKKTTPKKEMIDRLNNDGYDPTVFDCVIIGHLPQLGLDDSNWRKECSFLELPESTDRFDCSPHGQLRPKYSFDKGRKPKIMCES